MIGVAAAHACFRKKAIPDAADTVSAVSGIRLPPECRFRWDCKRRKRFNAGVPGAVAPGKTNLWSPPSRWEGGGGISFPFGEGGQKRKRGQCRQATKTASTPVWYRSGRSSRQPTGQAPRKGTCTAGTTSAARVQPWGCKGRSPLHKITLISPFPLGRGRGGYPSPSGKGGRKEREGSVGRRQRRQEIPFGTAVAGRAGNQPDKPPARVPVRQGQPVPPGFSPGDARGEAPCIK